MTTASGSIRQELPGDVREYRWEWMKQFLYATDSEYRLFRSVREKQKDRLFIFSEVTEATYLEEIQSSQDKFITTSIDSYSSLERILLFTMTTMAHEQAAQSISWSLAIKLNGMGLEREVLDQSRGIQRKRQEQKSRRDIPADSLASRKIGNRSRIFRILSQAWEGCSLVDHQSGGDVKAVLTTKLNQKSREITIHKWVPVLGVTRILSSHQQQVPSLSTTSHHLKTVRRTTCSCHQCSFDHHLWRTLFKSTPTTARNGHHLWGAGSQENSREGLATPKVQLWKLTRHLFVIPSIPRFWRNLLRRRTNLFLTRVRIHEWREAIDRQLCC